MRAGARAASYVFIHLLLISAADLNQYDSLSNRPQQAPLLF